MTAQAERTKAFCSRVLDYSGFYHEYRHAEQLLDEDLRRRDNKEILKALKEIRRVKKQAGGRLRHVKREVTALIDAANLPPRLRSLMIWRYENCLVWSQINQRLRLTKRYVLSLHEKALEMMAPVFEKRYPNWKP